MRYDNPELVDKLASEYVLGTLHGGARRRFEHLLKYRRDVQKRVTYWEQYLSELSEMTDPVSPPKSVWQGIHAKINNQGRAEPSRMWFWRAWSGVATLACAGLLVMLFQPPTGVEPAPTEIAKTSAQPESHIALVGDNKAPLWVLSADLETGQLSARAINATAAGLDKAFELWVLPNEGAPMSVGLLPVNGDSVTHTLPAGLSALLRESKGLAISIEPSGGSPTGLPTGEVIQTTNIWEL